MKNYKFWTKEEEEILVQAITANPHNLQQCFREVSSKINRTHQACMFHWYETLGNPESKKYVGALFVHLGRKSTLTDRKNKYTTVGWSTKSTTVKHKVSIWNKILKLLGL